MTKERPEKGQKAAGDGRDDRLKQALRQNLQKRKAQARKRGSAGKTPAETRNED